MSRDYKRRTFPGGMPSCDSPCPPPSPPPPSPTRSLSPAHSSSSRPHTPRRTPPPSHNPDSPRSLSPQNLSLFPQKTRSQSPQHQLTSPTAVLIRPTTSHSRRTSLQSMPKMPPIREHANSIFSDVATAAHRRSKSSFYQYGEDYITAYDRVGLTASPTPRSQSRTSLNSTGSGGGGRGPTRSLRRSASERSSKSGRSSRYASSNKAAATRSLVGGPGSYKGHRSRGSAGTEGTYTHEQDRERDLESGPVSEPESELEKGVMTAPSQKRSWWRRWRRFVVILLVVLGLAGVAVGIIFGTRSR